MSFGCREVEKQEIQWLQPRCALVFRCAPQSTMVLISGSNSQTADLLWALNLPYKFTYAGFVLVCILCAFMATTCPAPAKFMWFGEFTCHRFIYYNFRKNMFPEAKVKKLCAR